jgi:hypothetical protein
MVGRMTDRAHPLRLDHRKAAGANGMEILVEERRRIASLAASAGGIRRQRRNATSSCESVSGQRRISCMSNRVSPSIITV